MVRPAWVHPDHRDPGPLAGRPTARSSSGASTRSGPSTRSGCWRHPEYKRRWASEAFDKQAETALRGWLLDRLEDRALWFSPQGHPTPQSVSQLADVLGRDAEFRDVAELWQRRRDVDLTEALTALLEPEAVPYLAAHRLKDSGLRKFAEWEHTWALQRREDAGENLAPSRCRRSTPRRLPQAVVLVGARQARRAQGAVHPLPGRRAGDRPDRRCSAGPAGTTPSSPWPWPRSSSSGRPRAPTTRRSSRWWPGWPSCSRGSSSGTRRSTRCSASARPRSAANNSGPLPNPRPHPRRPGALASRPLLPAEGGPVRERPAA